MQNNLYNDFRNINEKLLQFIEILNSYFVNHNNLKDETNTNLRNFIKSKLNEQEYDYFNKIMSKEKIDELKKIDRKNYKTKYKNFFWKASYHVLLGKKVDLNIKEWLETYQGNFVSYHNKKIYNISIKKSLKEIEKVKKVMKTFLIK